MFLPPVPQIYECGKPLTDLLDLKDPEIWASLDLLKRLTEDDWDLWIFACSSTFSESKYLLDVLQEQRDGLSYESLIHFSLEQCVVSRRPGEGPTGLGELAVQQLK